MLKEQIFFLKKEENLVIKNMDKTIEDNAMWKESDTDK